MSGESGTRGVRTAAWCSCAGFQLLSGQDAVAVIAAGAVLVLLTVIMGGCGSSNGFTNGEAGLSGSFGSAVGGTGKDGEYPAESAQSSADDVNSEPLQGTIAAGGGHSCVLHPDGTAECWSDNEYGQANPPQGTFTAIAAGDYHACGLRADGTAECWGHDGYRQNDPPQGTFAAIIVGGYHSCGLRTDDRLECWNGEPDVPDTAFAAVSAGDYHVCGLRADGGVECWGSPIVLSPSFVRWQRTNSPLSL